MNVCHAIYVEDETYYGASIFFQVSYIQKIGTTLVVSTWFPHDAQWMDILGKCQLLNYFRGTFLIYIVESYQVLTCLCFGAEPTKYSQPNSKVTKHAEHVCIGVAMSQTSDPFNHGHVLFNVFN